MAGFFSNLFTSLKKIFYKILPSWVSKPKKNDMKENKIKEAQKKADEEAQKKADEEAQKKAGEEAQKKADEEAQKKADEERKKRKIIINGYIVSVENFLEVSNFFKSKLKFPISSETLISISDEAKKNFSEEALYDYCKAIKFPLEALDNILQQPKPKSSFTGTLEGNLKAFQSFQQTALNTLSSFDGELTDAFISTYFHKAANTSKNVVEKYYIAFANISLFLSTKNAVNKPVKEYCKLVLAEKILGLYPKNKASKWQAFYNSIDEEALTLKVDEAITSWIDANYNASKRRGLTIKNFGAFSSTKNNNKGKEKEKDTLLKLSLSKALSDSPLGLNDDIKKKLSTRQKQDTSLKDAIDKAINSLIDEKIKEEQAFSTSKKVDPLEKLQERGLNVTELEDNTEQLRTSSSNFADAAKILENKYAPKNKKKKATNQR